MTTLIAAMQNSVLLLESSKNGWKTHEITLLKIKHIRLREKYGKGEISHEAKTGSCQIFLNNIKGNL